MAKKYSFTGKVVGYGFLLLTLLFFALPNYSFAQSAEIIIDSLEVVEGDPVFPSFSCRCTNAGGATVPCASQSVGPSSPVTGLSVGESFGFLITCRASVDVVVNDFVNVEVVPDLPDGVGDRPTGDAPSGFVPCGGINCSFCHLVQLGQNVLNWIFGIVFVIFGVIMVVAGFGLVTSGGNQSKLDEAKQKFSNAIIGIIIVFAAWLIVDTLLKAAVPDGELSGVNAELGMWHTIRCDLARQE